jgi:hypothetical protein
MKMKIIKLETGWLITDLNIVCASKKEVRYWIREIKIVEGKKLLQQLKEV